MALFLSLAQESHPLMLTLSPTDQIFPLNDSLRSTNKPVVSPLA